MTGVSSAAESITGGGGPNSDPSPSARRPIQSLRRLTANQLAAHAAALQEGLRLYQTMFERSTLGQLIVDFPTFRIDVVNRAFCSMAGFSVDELVGSDLAMVFATGQNPAGDIVNGLTDGAEGYAAQRFLQRRDGTILPALITVSVVRD